MNGISVSIFCSNIASVLRDWFLSFLLLVCACPVRGIREGWFPEIAAPNVPSETIYGSCEDIKNNTTESEEIIHTYPWGDPAYWRGPLVNQSDEIKGPHSEPVRPKHHFSGLGSQVVAIAAFVFVFLGIQGYRAHRRNRKKWEYTEIQT